MAKIVWKGVTRADAGFLSETEPLPADAVRLQLPENIMGSSMVYGVPFMLVCIFCLVGKAAITHVFPLHPAWLAAGILLGILLCTVHELLHVFLIAPAQSRILNSFLWPMAMVGLVSPCPDYMNVCHVLKEMPKDALIQDGKDGLYWYGK